jgi:hypothetical protein
MPYIPEEDRKKIDHFVDSMPHAAHIDSAGKLNYAISRLIHQYMFASMARNGQSKLSYSLLNEVHGVLHCADMELYRTVTAPYEDSKVEVNGSVSSLDAPIGESYR